MKALLEPIKELSEFTRMKASSHKPGVTMIDGCLESQKAHLLSALGEDAPYKLIIAANESTAMFLQSRGL